MILTNTKNRINKKVEINDIVDNNGDDYIITGETQKSWRLTYTGNNPNVKKTDTYNKNTFEKRFFFNGKFWGYIRISRVPNFDYI